MSAGCKSPASFFTLSWDKELPRIALPRTRVNRGKEKGKTSSPFTDTRCWLAAPYDPECQDTRAHQQD